MVAAVTYDEHSFWAGVAIGRRLKGYTAYGTMMGWDPDGDLILRPITQGVLTLHFQEPEAVSILPFTDAVQNAFPIKADESLLEMFDQITFTDPTFTVLPINERLLEDLIIHAFSVSEEINPLEYDDTIVFINSSGAFTMDEMTRTFTSTEQTVDIGTMQEVTVKVDEFAEVATQEVTT